MVQFFLRIFLAACLLGTQMAQARDEGVFRLGVAPHTSARVILEMYQPLRLNLEQALGMPVEVHTAPDFTEFGRRSLAQGYDLAITTGHQARLYQTDAGYLPVLTYKADFRAVALVVRDGYYQKAADLKGATVLGLSPSSLVTLWGAHWLRTNNLAEAVTLRYVSAADSVARQLLAGDAAMAFTSLANYQKLPADQQAGLRVLAESEPMAGRVYMLNKSRAGLRTRIEAALNNFAASEEGRRYFAENKLEGYRKLRPRELEAMDAFAAQTRAVLSGR